MVYTNDFNSIEGVDYLVILDLFTGTELGRIPTPATKPSISQTRAGAYNDFYYCSNEPGQLLGYFHRVSLDETGILSNRNLNIAADFKISPNPFRDQTTITWDVTDHSVFQAQLLNTTGQVVQKYQNLRGGSKEEAYLQAFTSLV